MCEQSPRWDNPCDGNQPLQDDFSYSAFSAISIVLCKALGSDDFANDYASEIRDYLIAYAIGVTETLDGKPPMPAPNASAETVIRMAYDYVKTTETAQPEGMRIALEPFNNWGFIAIQAFHHARRIARARMELISAMEAIRQFQAQNGIEQPWIAID